MGKLSLSALIERAEAVASEELLNSITGGLMAECHDGSCTASIPADFTITYGDCSDPCGTNPPSTSPYNSWGEFYNALGQMFIGTGL